MFDGLLNEEESLLKNAVRDFADIARAIIANTGQIGVATHEKVAVAV